jgi:hypothetical protein
LHQGKYSIAVEYQVGAGPVGPNRDSLTPGIMVSVSKLSLVKTDQEGPLVVNAAEISPKTSSKPKKS